MLVYARLGVLGLVVAGLLLAGGSRLAGADGSTTERVSVASDGSQANERSYWPAITTDGRYGAFTSRASNLVPEDTNNADDVFVHDRQTGITHRVSVDSSGNQGNSSSGLWGPAISGDGRYVAFQSSATNLVPDDVNGYEDVFVHDRLTGITERVSMDSSGNQANGYSGFLGLAISADGRYAAFDSSATNLVSDDTNGQSDVFLHDRLTGTTERVSVDSDGNEVNGWADVEAISPDGRYVAFTSPASNLVPNDTNTCPVWQPSCLDVFLHDRQTGATERVSVDSSGNQGNAESLSPAISGDARYVAFWSKASNLVPGDTNGTDDVFVHDRQTGVTKRVSVDSAGNQGNGPSGMSRPAIGLDSRFVAFESLASNLVPGDINGFDDVFVDPYEPDSESGPVGGLAELPDVSGSSGPPYAALAAGLAAAVVALSAGGWYARRRRLR